MFVFHPPSPRVLERAPLLLFRYFSSNDPPFFFVFLSTCDLIFSPSLGVGALQGWAAKEGDSALLAPTSFLWGGRKGACFLRLLLMPSPPPSSLMLIGQLKSQFPKIS